MSTWTRFMSDDFWANHSDPFSQGYGLVDGPPWTILSIIAAYLLFVKVIGPLFMRHRPPYDLKSFIFYYNLVHITGNGICSIAALWITTGTYDCWTCKHTGDKNNPNDVLLMKLSFVYMMAKFLDLVDTVIFVLRKKDKQASALHVIHHAVMPMSTYLALKFSPIGRSSIIGIVNSVVHTVMYTYYLLASMPSMSNHLWWKRYMTQLQIIQFVIFLAHSIQGLVMMDTCTQYPVWLSVMELLHAIFFIRSFTDFFFKTYRPTMSKVMTPLDGHSLASDKLKGA